MGLDLRKPDFGNNKRAEPACKKQNINQSAAEQAGFMRGSRKFSQKGSNFDNVFF